VGVTQLDLRVGNYVLCRATKSEVNPNTIDFVLETLLGNREDALLGVYARQITEQLIPLYKTNSSLSVLLGISLHPTPQVGRDPKLFRLVVDTVVGLIREAVAVAASSTA
jgi:hypothetical protein